MPRPRIILHVALLGLAILCAGPAAADWLITLEGQLIETRGPWAIDGGLLTYADTSGVEHSLAVDDVDLEASEETTALFDGRDYLPPEEPEAAPFVLTSPSAQAAAGDEPKIILYMTSWCGYCRKTRKLLTQLGVDFVAKDIEKSRQAAAEFRKKNGRSGGVPLLDVDGKLVRGYNEKLIRKLVAELRAD